MAKVPRKTRKKREIDVTPDTFAFGPSFFKNQLSGLARDSCPSPEEHLPCVEVHLQDGEVLTVCHTIALAAQWLALAVFDDEGEQAGHRMRTELVPYFMITRVTIRPVQREAHHMGFEVRSNVPVLDTTDALHSAEDALRAVMGLPQPAPGAAKDASRKKKS